MLRRTTYNIVISTPVKVVLEGESVSRAGLDRCIEILNEYSKKCNCAAAIHTHGGSVRNLVKYIPPEKYPNDDHLSAALIPYAPLEALDIPTPADKTDDDEDDFDYYDDDDDDDDDDDIEDVFGGR